MGALQATPTASTATITGLAPDTISTGSESTFQLYVYGTGFQPTAVILWNSTPLPTTYISAGALTATIPQNIIIPTAGKVQVQNPGEDPSNLFLFPVRGTHSTPRFYGAWATYTYTPGTYYLNTNPLRVYAVNVEPGAVLLWNGTVVPVEDFANGEAFDVPNSVIQVAGPVTVAIQNPGGFNSVGGFNGAGITFNVPAVRTLSSVTPNQITPGSTNVVLTINGTNFAPGDQVVEPASPSFYLATTFISSTQLQAILPASELAGTRTLQIWVETTAPGGGTDNAGAPIPNGVYSSANQLPIEVGTASCTYSLSSNLALAGAAQSTNTVQVIAPAGCPWSSFTTPAGFVNVTSGANGSGNGTVTYSVQPLFFGMPERTAVITIAGQPFAINQVNGCEYGFTPASTAVGTGPTVSTISVGAFGGCIWNAASNVPWLTASGAGPGNGTINYNVSPNLANTGRSGQITAGGQVFNVVQAGNAPCTYSLQQTTQSFTPSGGNATVTVQTPAGCSWTATSNVGWLAITAPPPGSGAGTVGFSAASNPSATARTGSLTIAGLTYAVTQSGTSGGIVCSPNVASPPLVAMEGRTEVLGDLTISCAGVRNPTSVDFILTFNTNVTNTIVGSGNATDAVMINDTCPLGVLCIQQGGQIAGYNSIRWRTILTPVSGGLSTGNAPTVQRITNIRVDASLLTLGATFQEVPITAILSTSSPSPITITNPAQTMGYAAPSTGFLVDQPSLPGGDGSITIPLQFWETSVAALHAAGSTPASRLRVTFGNVPPYVQAFAPIFPNEGNTQAQLYSADANGAGGSPIAGSVTLNGVPYVPLTLVNGGTTLTWVVTGANPAAFDSYTFPLIVQNASPSDVGQIVQSVTWGLAPVSSVSVSGGAPVPRYHDVTQAQKFVNLRISTASPVSTGQPGSSVTYVSKVTNDDSAQTANHVRVLDYMGPAANIVSCTSSDGQPCGTGATAELDYASLAPGQSQTITIVAAPSSGLPDGTPIDHSIGVVSDDPNASVVSTSAHTGFIVLTAQPAPVANMPPSGSSAPGTSQTFSFQFSHPDGYSNLQLVDVLINNGLDGRHACYLAYSVQSSTLFLVDDGGDAGGPFAGGVALGNNAIIQNSQCAVSLVSATGVGTTLSLTVNITFQSGFGGGRITFVSAQDFVGHNSGWSPLGVWQVATAPTGTISVGSVNPGRGSAVNGTAQPFTLTLTDSKGTSDFGVINLLVNSGLDGRQACYLAYASQSNTLILLDDPGTAYAGSMPLSANTASISNSQCSISAAGSSANSAGNTLTLTLNITFKSGFKGNRVLYVAGRDKSEGNNSGWQPSATWTVQ